MFVGGEEVLVRDEIIKIPSLLSLSWTGTEVDLVCDLDYPVNRLKYLDNERSLVQKMRLLHSAESEHNILLFLLKTTFCHYFV